MKTSTTASESITQSLEATTSTPNLEAKSTTEPTPSTFTETPPPVSQNSETVRTAISTTPKATTTINALHTTSSANTEESSIDPIAFSTLNTVTNPIDGSTPGSIYIIIENQRNKSY